MGQFRVGHEGILGGFHLFLYGVGKGIKKIIGFGHDGDFGLQEMRAG